MSAKVEVVFKTTLEGLFQAIGDARRTPALLEKLAKHGLTAAIAA